MSKKLSAWATLLAFIIFELACTVHTTKTVPPEKAYGEDFQVLGVLKKSGEYVEFPKQSPGQVMGDRIVGSPLQAGAPVTPSEITIPNTEIKRIVHRDGRPAEVEKVDGTKIPLGEILKMGENETMVRPAGPPKGRALPVAIPLAEVDMVQIRKVDPGMTFLAVMGGLALAVAVPMLIVALTKESCPFIYSWDGRRYVFDAEPFGGAICEGLKRTELGALDYLAETDGTYRLLVTNEVDETQYTDRLELVVVDHPQGTIVVSEFSGAIHAINPPLPPTRAADENGRDLLPLVREKDWLFWQTRESDLERAAAEGGRDDLVFEFPKPASATSARLVVNGCSTLWGSQMIKRVLELHGRTVGEWYEDANRRGPSLFKTMAWSMREELYRLQIRVETDRGWIPRGMIAGGGPLVAEDRIYDLDISDVRGDVLRIRLTPPPGYWMVNWLAVDYGADSSCAVTELAPVRAADGTGRDVRERLALDDGDYLAMPNFGDRTEVTFLAPPRREGLSRTVFVKASGYYSIHLRAAGEPQTELLRRVIEEPGFIVRYSAAQYSKWKEEAGGRARSR